MVVSHEVGVPVQTFTSDRDRVLAGTYFSPDKEVLGTKRVDTLFIHGLGSSRNGYVDRAQTVTENGIHSLTFNLSPPGDKQRDYFADVVAAYDWLHAQSTEDREIAVCGTSYGAFLAVLLTSFRHVDHLLLRAPALASEEDDPKIKVPLHNFRGSLWVVLSENDEAYPPDITDKYWDAAIQASPKIKQVIPKADHALSSLESKQAFLAILENWSQTLKASISPSS